MTPLELCVICRTGELSTTREPSCLAILVAITCEPPTNRDIWAPLRVSKLRSNVPGLFSSPEAAM